MAWFQDGIYASILRNLLFMQTYRRLPLLALVMLSLWHYWPFNINTFVLAKPQLTTFLRISCSLWIGFSPPIARSSLVVYIDTTGSQNVSAFTNKVSLLFKKLSIRWCLLLPFRRRFWYVLENGSCQGGISPAGGGVTMYQGKVLAPVHQMARIL